MPSTSSCIPSLRNGKCMKKVEPFCLTYEGVSISVRIYTPETPADNHVFLLCHEFGMSMVSTARYARELCKAGIKTYIFDFSGSGAGKSRGRKSTQMSVLTEKQDLSAVLDFVKKKEPGCKIVLGGGSQGGFVAALLAAERCAEVEKLVLIYPALCIPDDAREGRLLGRKFDPAIPPDKILVLGYVKLGRKYMEDARMLDPWKEIQGFQKPVLLLHGDQDGIVPLSYSQKAASVYKNAHLCVYPGARHLFPRRKDIVRAASDIRAFVLGYQEALCIDVKITKLMLKKDKLTISFTGKSIGNHFAGTIKPGAEDVWTFEGLQCISKRADYTVSTTAGDVHIVNADTGSGWKPTVEAEASCGYDFGDCYAIVKQRIKGPLVRIYAKKDWVRSEKL